MTPIKKSVQICSVLLAVFLMALSFPINVFATDDEAEPVGVGFYVAAELPTNQKNNGKTYYDLRVEADSQQRVSLFVGNTGTEAIAVHLEINNNYTNTAGDLGYRIHGIKDESLLVSMEDIATLSVTRVELLPGESKEIFITLDIPSEPFLGEIIGGIVATKEIPQEDMEAGASIVNEYSYVIGLVVSESDEIVNPKISFLGIEAEVANHKTAAVHSIRNNAPLLMKDVKMSIDISPQGSPVTLWSLRREDVKFAPNSVMDYIFYLGEEKIEPGKYESHITLQWQEHEWKFMGTFQISSSEAKAINTDAIRLYEEETSVMSKPVAITLVVLLLLLLFVLLLTIIHMSQNAKNEKR